MKSTFTIEVYNSKHPSESNKYIKVTTNNERDTVIINTNGSEAEVSVHDLISVVDAIKVTRKYLGE